MVDIDKKAQETFTQCKEASTGTQQLKIIEKAMYELTAELMSSLANRAGFVYNGRPPDLESISRATAKAMREHLRTHYK